MKVLVASDDEDGRRGHHMAAGRREKELQLQLQVRSWSSDNQSVY